MPEVVIETPHSYAHLHHGRLAVRPPKWAESPAANEPAPSPELALDTIDHLLIAEDVQISTQTLAALLREDVPLSILDRHGRLLGTLAPPRGNEGALRLQQYRRVLDPDFCLLVSAELVSAKIANQRRLLQRLEGNRPGFLRGELDELDQWRDRVAAADSPETLLGCEGQASRAYFAAWARFLPDAFPFEKRSTRPPANAVNACLSFGYTVVFQEILTLLQRRGLDPALGFLHAPENGRASLALDLVEPFRPAIVDALTVRLLGHQILRENHFEPHGTGVYLNSEGRTRFFEQYHQRMKRRFFSTRTGRRATMREELENEVLSVKRAVETGEAPHAFRIP